MLINAERGTFWDTLKGGGWKFDYYLTFHFLDSSTDWSLMENWSFIGKIFVNSNMKYILPEKYIKTRWLEIKVIGMSSAEESRKWAEIETAKKFS